MNSHQLFRRSRIRLALWYALVMGVILSLSGLGVYRSLLQSNWEALEREIESIAGTLHDSLEPMLPTSGVPTPVLQQILPELCLVDQPCNNSPTLIQRHTAGISDRSTYYIRLFDHHGQLLAFSPNQPLALPETLNATPWQTLQATNGSRYHQFTTILHSTHLPSAHVDLQSAPADAPAHALSPHSSWGYLQIGRTLEPFDAETRRIQWILAIGFPLTLLLVAFSSWWLSGLAMQPIYQSYQQQQQFTANAAHELRSPLASLLATVEAMTRVSPSDPHSIASMLNTVERQGRRLGQLINDLLLLSSLEQNTSAIPFQPCCLNDLISDLAEEFLELAIAAEIKLACDLPADLIQVLGDEPQLYRLVSNLITNAIHYTPPGGDIHISLEQRDRMALVTIKDSGMGIPAADLPRIFERFYRVDSDRSRNTGGAGLGLAIVQAIAYRHQGYLMVTSDPGQGSTFTVHLPALPQKIENDLSS